MHFPKSFILVVYRDLFKFIRFRSNVICVALLSWNILLQMETTYIMNEMKQPQKPEERKGFSAEALMEFNIYTFNFKVVFIDFILF